MENTKNNIDVMKVTGDSCDISSFEAIQTHPGPVLFFVGGLMHIGGHDNDEKLCGMLSALACNDTGIFFIQEKKETPWKKKILQGVAFETTGVVSATAKILADNIFTSQLQGTSNLANLKKAFSRITLFGYSFGTALVRQMERHLHDRMTHAGLSKNAADNILSSLATLDLAPTYSLYPQENGMSRLVVAYRGDTVTKQADEVAHKLGRFLYPPHLKICEAIGHANLRNALILTAETGTPTEREVVTRGQDKLICFDAFEEAHSLYMYMNTNTRLMRGDTIVDQYVSLPTAELCRAFLTAALHTSTEAIKTSASRNNHELLRSFQNAYLTEIGLQTLSRKFGKDNHHFENVVAAGQQPSFRPSLRKPSPVQRMTQVWG